MICKENMTKCNITTIIKIRLSCDKGYKANVTKCNITTIIKIRLSCDKGYKKEIKLAIEKKNTPTQ